MQNNRKNNFKKRRREFKVPISFSLEQLQSIIMYLFTDSIYIKRKDIHKVQLLFRIIEPSIYEKEVNLDCNFQFIKSILDTKLNSCIMDYNIIIDKAINDNSHKDEIMDIIAWVETMDDLPEPEIKYVTNLVSEHLTYAYLFKYKDKMSELFEELELGTDNLYELNAQLKDQLTMLMKDMRTAKSTDDSENEFDLSEESLNFTLIDTLKELKQPSNFLVTGIQMLNKMLSGGFEQDRHYLFFGISGVGKK